MTTPITVLMAVHNGAPWLRRVLDALSAQTHRAHQVLAWDNASTDATRDILSAYPHVTVIPSDENIGYWAAVERMLPRVTGTYVVCLTDVELAPQYLAVSAQALDAHPTLGAVQGMLLHPKTGRVDGYGFSVYRSRAVTIRGHGDVPVRGSEPFDVFGVEGAAPVFRKVAIDDIRVSGWFVDPSYRVGPLGYGDDLDIAWRMRLRGWGQLCCPAAVGFHDRSTTQTRARTITDRIRRRHMRATIPLQKRQLDWLNVRFTVMKNDAMMDLLRDALQIAAREVLVLGYTILFEPAVLMIIPRFFRLLPSILRTRRIIRARTRIPGGSVRQYLS